MRDRSFLALDLEYTCRDTRLPLELGLVEVDAGEITARHTFWFRVVGHPWPHVTGSHHFGFGKRGQVLTKEIYERSPFIVDAWPTIAAIIAGRPVFAHNAGLDIACLRKGFDAHGSPWPCLRFGCTVSLARAVWQPDPGRYDSYSLEVLARRLFPTAGLFTGNRYRFGHDPAEDAEGAARVLLAAFAETGTSSLDDLLAHTGRRPQALEPERCETSQGWVARRLEPPLTPTSLVFDRQAQRLALLEIRREWRADQAILDARRYPHAADPLPPPYHPPCRRRFR